MGIYNIPVWHSIWEIADNEKARKTRVLIGDGLFILILIINLFPDHELTHLLIPVS
jgi:hypothetical protein